MEGVEQKTYLGFDERQLRVPAIEVSFFAQADPESWRMVLREIGCSVKELESQPGEPVRWEASFLAIPELLEHGSQFLSADVHPFLRSPSETHWTFRLGPIPSPSPPSHVVETSSRVGGYPGVLDRIASHWPGPQSLEAEVKVTYLLDMDGWESPFGPRKRLVTTPLEVQGIKASLTRQLFSWTLEPKNPVSTLTDIGIIDGMLGLMAEGQQTINLGRELFSTVEKATWDTLSRFMKRKRRGKAGRRKP